MSEPVKPRRRLQMTVTIAADSDDELLSALRDLVDQQHAAIALGARPGVRGRFFTTSPGCSCDGQVAEDPEMTGERYQQELSAYLRFLEARPETST